MNNTKWCALESKICHGELVKLHQAPDSSPRRHFLCQHHNSRAELNVLKMLMRWNELQSGAPLQI